MNDQVANVQKTINKTRDEVAEKLDNLSFQSAKDSLGQATKQAYDNFQSVSESASKVAGQAVREGVDQAQRLNQDVSRHATSRLEEYSEFVKEHPISATAGAIFLGYVLSRWIR